MNEIERIISEGFWDRSFLEPETICDFYVDEARKKIWLISLDLLREFDRVCRKHGLRYFIYGGTLLGAVRHHGFIPWDDDIDVAMLREDYSRLLSYADEFTSPYFLQSPKTDKGYFFSYNKLRNVNTSRVSKTFMYEKFCQGMALDIFPFDFCNEYDGQDKFNRVRSLILDLST